MRQRHFGLLPARTSSSHDRCPSNRGKVTKAYGRVGIQGSIGPDITLTANPCTTPWWTIDGAITAGIDVIVDVFITDMAWTITQARILQRTIAQAPPTNPAPCGTDWTGISKATYDVEGTHSEFCGSQRPLCALPGSVSGSSEVRLLNDGRARMIFDHHRTTSLVCWSVAEQDYVTSSSRSDTVDDRMVDRASHLPFFGPGRWPGVSGHSSGIGWDFLGPAQETVTTCGGQFMQPLASSAGCGLAVSRVFAAAGVEIDASSTTGETTIVITEADNDRCSWGGTSFGRWTGAGELRVQYRYTRLPDADGDGIPDQTDPTPSVFTPLV